MNLNLQKIAQRYFNLDLPCTEKALQRAYYRVAKTCHSDIFPGDEEKAKKFKRLNIAHELLTAHREIFIEDDAPRTMGGDLLSELGKGIPGGSTCGGCGGKGYNSIQIDSFISCKRCAGTGYVIKCPSCKGRGKLCSQCKGVGWLGVVSMGGNDLVGVRECEHCGGEGGFRTSKPQFRYYLCDGCFGAGQQPPTHNEVR
jgi:DnaJ-class molecular chaperone